MKLKKLSLMIGIKFYAMKVFPINELPDLLIFFPKKRCSLQEKYGYANFSFFAFLLEK